MYDADLCSNRSCICNFRNVYAYNGPECTICTYSKISQEITPRHPAYLPGQLQCHNCAVAYHNSVSHKTSDSVMVRFWPCLLSRRHGLVACLAPLSFRLLRPYGSAVEAIKVRRGDEIFAFAQKQTSLDKQICFTAILTVCLHMQIIQKLAIHVCFKIQLVQCTKRQGNLLRV